MKKESVKCNAAWQSVVQLNDEDQEYIRISVVPSDVVKRLNEQAVKKYTEEVTRIHPLSSITTYKRSKGEHLTDLLLERGFIKQRPDYKQNIVFTPFDKNTLIEIGITTFIPVQKRINDLVQEALRKMSFNTRTEAVTFAANIIYEIHVEGYCDIADACINTSEICLDDAIHYGWTEMPKDIVTSRDTPCMDNFLGFYKTVYSVTLPEVKDISKLVEEAQS